MIVVDTNVVSKLMRLEPAEVVVGWVQRHDPRELSVSAVTVAENLYGTERLVDGQRKKKLRALAQELFTQFVDDVLPFDSAAAMRYAQIIDQRDRQGAPIGGVDAQIAAMCWVDDPTLATRNEHDFVDVEVRIMNPWSGHETLQTRWICTSHAHRRSADAVGIVVTWMCV